MNDDQLSPTEPSSSHFVRYSGGRRVSLRYRVVVRRLALKTVILAQQRGRFRTGHFVKLMLLGTVLSGGGHD